MTDNDPYSSDEYQFSDQEVMSTDTTVEGSGLEAEPTVDSENNNVIRNAIIVVVLVVLAMLLYKLFGSSSNETDIPAITPAPVAQVPPPTTVPAAPMVQAAPIEVTKVDSKVDEKLYALDSAQKTMSSDLSSMNNQLIEMNKNINALMAKMSELNTVVMQLNNKVEEESHEIELLKMKQVVPKSIHHSAIRTRSYPKYNIQAVIPGRAWLIATNGSTLTVREGTVVDGYGMVKLIDPEQGRVLTSSGRIIRFSQEDS